MNRIFSPGEGWPGFPIESYGRLDQTEPINVEGASEAVFAFDVVDASWPLFSPDQLFDLNNGAAIRERQLAFWFQMFRAPPDKRPSDPFEKAPIYRIEVTARRGDRFFDLLSKFAEDEWVKINLAAAGDFEVDVYGGLFVESVPAYFVNIAPVPDLAVGLSAAFDMDTWPDATEDEIVSALASSADIDFLVAYDVGQGAANGLLDASETTRLYFDLGGGVYGNAHTRPTPLRFCWRGSPPIVLSHWDSDHWAGEASDPAAYNRTWVAPRQSISSKHATFAAKVLSAGGTILIWGAPPAAKISFGAGKRNLTLARCTGPRSSRNGSGISCLLDSPTISEAWLLTGDAGYHQLGLLLPTYVNAVVAPHHGADMGASSVPPPRPAGYARVLYSFGPGNKHGKSAVRHPTSVGVHSHASQRWNHGAWPAGAPATMVAGGDVLATAKHPGNHLDGAAVGWSAAPLVPFTSVPHAVAGASTGCTGKVVQG